MAGVHRRGEKKDFLALLREVREEAELSQTALAGRLGKPQSFVSKIESGERRLTVLELHHVCSACGTTGAEFMSRLAERIKTSSR